MKSFLTAYWKNLLFFNYDIDPKILKPLLPAGTELDFHDNTCYASLVGFMFLETRIKGIGIPFHRNFEEFNLRFYVRVKEGNQWKRGVVFKKEIVPKRMICLTAKILYGEHYHYHPMRNTLTEEKDTLDISYEWLFKKEWNYIKATVRKEAAPAPENSVEAFITEHYLGYTKLTVDRTSEYHVIHPSWNIHPVITSEVRCNVAGLYGDAFKEYLSKPPVSVFMADGSAVTVHERKVHRY